MKNFFSFLSRESFEKSFGVLEWRFPLPTLIILLISGILFFIVNSESTDEMYMRMILTGIVTFFLSTGCILWIETWKKRPIDARFPILPIVYGIFFYFSLWYSSEWRMESVSYFLLHLTGFLSLLFFAPYITRILQWEEKSIEYTNYFSRVAWMILMSMIVWLSLLLLGFIAIGSVTALFDLSSYSWNDKLYGNWAIISLALIAPLYALIHIPEASTIEKRSYEINRFFSFLIRYIATPAIYIYFTILYAYSIKVLMNFGDWPKGIISWMVIGFSSFGYLTYIFSKAYEEGSVVRIFRRYFPYVVIPQIFMLFYALYLRIAQYDITMNRYFVIAFGLWLFGISVYFIVSKRKSLAIIVASLSLISILISLGPWSVFSFPLARQEARLMQNLETAKILKNGEIIPLADKNEISKELSGDIYSGISYLCGFDDCSVIKKIFPLQLGEIEEKWKTEWMRWNTLTWAIYPWASNWEIIGGVTEKIRVQQWYESSAIEPAYYQYNTKNSPWENTFPLDITWYDQILSVYGESGWWMEVKYPFISINPDDATLRYHGSSGTLDKILLPESMLGLNSSPNTNNLIEPADMVHSVSFPTREIRLYLNSYAVKNQSYTWTAIKNQNYYSINGFALVKERRWVLKSNATFH